MLRAFRSVVWYGMERELRERCGEKGPPYEIVG